MTDLLYPQYLDGIVAAADRGEITYAEEAYRPWGIPNQYGHLPSKGGSLQMGNTRGVHPAMQNILALMRERHVRFLDSGAGIGRVCAEVHDMAEGMPMQAHILALSMTPINPHVELILCYEQCRDAIRALLEDDQDLIRSRLGDLSRELRKNLNIWLEGTIPLRMCSYHFLNDLEKAMELSAVFDLGLFKCREAPYIHHQRIGLLPDDIQLEPGSMEVIHDSWGPASYTKGNPAVPRMIYDALSDEGGACLFRTPRVKEFEQFDPIFIRPITAEMGARDFVVVKEGPELTREQVRMALYDYLA